MVEWALCNHDIECPEVEDGGSGLQVREVAGIQQRCWVGSEHTHTVKVSLTKYSICSPFQKCNLVFCVTGKNRLNLREKRMLRRKLRHKEDVTGRRRKMS
jgi:hypothetical protein